MDCFFCDDPAAHPMTGAQYADDVVVCCACVRSFWAWFREQQNKRGRPGRDPKRPWRVHADFYLAAATNNPSLDRGLLLRVRSVRLPLLLSMEAFADAAALPPPDIMAEMQRMIEGRQAREDRAILKAIETGAPLGGPSSNGNGWGC